MALSDTPIDFSLIPGGPLYQLWRRTHLVGQTLEWVKRRILVLVLLTWIPLLLLSVAEAHFWGGSLKLPFLYDIETHVRLLLALPLLIVAELFVHQRMRPLIEQFLARGLIPDAAQAKFEAAIRSAVRLRNSVAAELLLLLFIYGVIVPYVWRTFGTLNESRWYWMAADGKPSLAGWWLGYVSLPLFQFLLLRWYFRLFIWARFLWQVSRLELNLMPTHPDRCGGIGFLSSVSKAFAPLLLAQGAMMAGIVANSFFYSGVPLAAFKVELIGLVALMLFTVLGPLLLFLPKLIAAKRTGRREYGNLAMHYVRAFDQKWLRGGAPTNEPLLGSADIQSLADLANSFAIVNDMRVVPCTTQTVLQLALVTLLPVGFLLLTVIPVEKMLAQLLKLIF